CGRQRESERRGPDEPAQGGPALRERLRRRDGLPGERRRRQARRPVRGEGGRRTELRQVRRDHGSGRQVATRPSRHTGSGRAAGPLARGTCRRMDLFLQLLLNAIVNGSHYALLGIGFGLIFGTTNIVHFAYGPIYTLAAYLA